MNLKFHSSVIIVKNLQLMREFYEGVLNHKVEFDYGNCIGFTGGLSLWQLDNAYPISKFLGEKYSAKGNSNLEICYETDEFTAVVEELKQLPIKYLHQVVEEKWGQLTLRIYDPERNLVEIGESMPCFIKRLKAQGLSDDELSKKVGLPIEMIKQYLLQ